MLEIHHTKGPGTSKDRWEETDVNYGETFGPWVLTYHLTRVEEEGPGRDSVGRIGGSVCDVSRPDDGRVRPMVRFPGPDLLIFLRWWDDGTTTR